jgi:SOS response associated peptidase (SRAP)
MRWSLVPAWWKKSPKEVPARFNARAEAVADKPMFRTAFKERRCIVPASGFFEWIGEKGAKQPHLFTAADGSPLLALRRHLGPLERSPQGRMGSLLHNHRSGASVWIEPYHLGLD